MQIFSSVRVLRGHIKYKNGAATTHFYVLVAVCIIGCPIDGHMTRSGFLSGIIITQKVAKKFDKRPHRCLVTPHSSKWIRLIFTPT